MSHNSGDTNIWQQNQSRPGLSSERAPQRQDNKFQNQTLEKEAISGQTSTKWTRRQDILTDWLSAVKWLWLWHGRSGHNRVEAGKNTSTVILANRKRRWKGNPVVSDETVMYGYESSATLTTDRLHYKLQTRTLVKEGAPKQRAMQFSDKRR
jgi:hypothetical protein